MNPPWNQIVPAETTIEIEQLGGTQILKDNPLIVAIWLVYNILSQNFHTERPDMGQFSQQVELLGFDEATNTWRVKITPK